MSEQTQETPAVNMDPELMRGVKVKIDLSPSGFNAAQEKPLSDQDRKDFMARQVRRLLMYVGQEGTDDDLQEWIKGLDDEKLVAFAEEYHHSLPYEIQIFLLDARERIKGLLPDIQPANANILMEEWIEDYRKSHDLEKEDIVLQGREAVMEVLAIAFERNGHLTEAERTTVRNMAKNITDETIIRRVMDYATGHSYVVMCLLRNPDFNLEHVRQLAEKVTESYKMGEHLDECRNILVEVSGHLARTLDNMILAYDTPEGKKDLDQALECVPKITGMLDEVGGGVNLFSGQISKALAAMRDADSLDVYARKLAMGRATLERTAEEGNGTNGNGNGNGKSEKIRTQNAGKAAAVSSGANNGEVFAPGSKRVTPSPKVTVKTAKPAVQAKPVHSGGGNRAKKAARVAAAKANAAAKRRRKQNGD